MASTDNATPTSTTSPRSDANSHLFRFANSGQSQSALARAPLLGVRTHYRSRSVTVNSGLNGLTVAASALFTTLINFKSATDYPDITGLYEHLCHEISAFETRAHSLGYRSETILIARYVLCASLDEAILGTAWGAYRHWDECKLLMAFQQEQWGGDRFFLILERLSEDPVLHIDLLELLYLCLSLGYEGKFYNQSEAHAQLLTITDDLYQLIRRQRGDLKKPLLIQEAQKNGLL